MSNKLVTELDRPFRVCGILNSRSFGDFISQVFFLNSIGAQFDTAQITLIYREDMGFKSAVASLLSNAITVAIPSEAELPTLELFNHDYTARNISANYQPWFKAQLFQQDFILTDSMAAVPTLSSFDPLGYLSVPSEQRASSLRQLAAMGLDERKWFACVHYREQGYKYKPTEVKFRDSDPANYLALTNYIIDHLGGQVVRLGHPQMAPFPERPGFIDLSRVDDAVLLQATAVSAARFVVAGPSGATVLATSQNVPLGHTDAVDFWAPLHAHDALRTIDVITPTGDLLNQRAMMDAGLTKLQLMQYLNNGQGYRIIKNSPETLAAMARYLYDTTTNIAAWRSIRVPASGPRPNTLSWPRRPIVRYHFL